MIGKDKAKCRKLNRLEKLRKAWNESLMTRGQNNTSMAEYAQSSYQPACNIKHCNKNCWALQSPTGFGEGMSGNDRNILQLESPVYTQHQIHSNHGYQMMSPKIAGIYFFLYIHVPYF